MIESIGVIAFLGTIVASAGAFARISRRQRVHIWGAPLLLVGWVAIAWGLLPSSIQSKGLLILPTGIVILFLLWWLADKWLVGREAWLLAIGAAVLSLRIPISVGAEDTMLLGPLYLLIIIGTITLTRAELRAQRSPDIQAPALIDDRGGATRLLDIGTAILPGIATLSLLWSWSVSSTIESLAFFLIPFLLIYVLVRSWVSAGISLRPAAISLLTSGLILAAIGIIQALTHRVWWNPKVVEANRFRPDFRTNSILWDPNMYGRVLVIVLLAFISWLLVTKFAKQPFVLGTLLCCLLTYALWHTYSQSSWLALGAGLMTLGVLTLPVQLRRWAALSIAILIVATIPIASKKLAGNDSEGRAHVVRTGLALASERPITGWGAGTFQAAAKARESEKGNRRPQLVSSHTTPVTIFAELGILGMFAYITLLTSAAVGVLMRWRLAAQKPNTPTGWPSAPIIWASATLMALFAHSLLYAGFFEDPVLWAALAVLASLPLNPNLSQKRIEGATAPVR